MSVLENFRPAFSPDPTDCPWVSEEDTSGDTNSMHLDFSAGGQYNSILFDFIYDKEECQGGGGLRCSRE